MSVETKESVEMVEGTLEPRNTSAEGERGIPAEVGKPPNPWGKGAKKLYMMCALVYLCSTMNGIWTSIPAPEWHDWISLGYDGSLMGSINAIPEYQAYYNLGNSGTASTGLVFSIFQIGQMVGALFSWVCDWQGRKIPMFGGCFGVVVASIITAVAPNRKIINLDRAEDSWQSYSWSVHRWKIPAELFLNHCNRCCASLLSRDLSSSISSDTSWLV